MAELPLLAHGNLVISPRGLEHDSFNGWSLPSDVELVDTKERIYLGRLMNGSEMLEELPIFLDECGIKFSYADNGDGDLPGGRLSLSCRTIKTGVATIDIHTEYRCLLEDTSSWIDEVNQNLRRCAKLGAAAYDAEIDEDSPALSLVANLRLEASDHHLREFVRELVAELHLIRNPVPLRADPPQPPKPAPKQFATMGELNGGRYPQLVQKHQLIQRGLLTREQVQQFMNHRSDQLMPPSVERTAGIIERAEFPEEPPSPFQPPSLEHRKAPITIGELSIGFQLPKECDELNPKDVTRLPPNEWTEEMRRVILPKWKDKNGNPLPLDKALFDHQGTRALKQANSLPEGRG